ncbi:MAG: BrnT family toxin [Thermoflexales bacterium]|nr:BrnT family toxin [Thermoflexales bacterium]
MATLEFEWDQEKAQINLEKHKVGFEEGATIFHDLLVATLSDPDHSEDEQRYIAIG